MEAFETNWKRCGRLARACGLRRSIPGSHHDGVADLPGLHYWRFGADLGTGTGRRGTLRTDAKVLHFSHASSDAKLDFVSNESNF